MMWQDSHDSFEWRQRLMTAIIQPAFVHIGVMIEGCRPCKFAAHFILIGLPGTKWAAFILIRWRLFDCRSVRVMQMIFVLVITTFPMCLRVVSVYGIGANRFDIATLDEDNLLKTFRKIMKPTNYISQKIWRQEHSEFLRCVADGECNSCYGRVLFASKWHSSFIHAFALVVPME